MKTNNTQQYSKENFENNFHSEIDMLKSVNFSTVHKIPELKLGKIYKTVNSPVSYSQHSNNYFQNFLQYKTALSFSFAVPALVAVFGFFFYTNNTSSNTQLALLQDSNARLIAEVQNLNTDDNN